jgi:metal-responsive CopG/Arc/MetJ family transcriptional regulator
MNKYSITPDGKVKISINIPFNTLKRLDEIRKKEKKNRSNWITQTVLEKLANLPKPEEGVKQ